MLQHMNQPLGPCLGKSLFDSLVSDFESEAPPAQLPDGSFTPDDELEDPAFDFSKLQCDCCDDDDIQMDDLPVCPPQHPDDVGGTAEQPRFVEPFEGCSTTHPGSKTFMDTFREDQFAEERRENIYFPWASKEEWAFASWLLRSRLSMAAIDSLLSLDIVSPF